MWKERVWREMWKERALRQMSLNKGNEMRSICVVVGECRSRISQSACKCRGPVLQEE